MDVAVPVSCSYRRELCSLLRSSRTREGLAGTHASTVTLANGNLPVFFFFLADEKQTGKPTESDLRVFCCSGSEEMRDQLEKRAEVARHGFVLLPKDN